MPHVNLCCWDLKLTRNLYSKLKEGTGDPAIIIGINTVDLIEVSYFIVLPLCSGGWHFRVRKFSWSLFSHESYGRINIFKNEEIVIALSCWSHRQSSKPFCGNKRHSLWDEKEGEIFGQSTHMVNTLEVGLSKQMTCTKVRLVAQTLLRLGEPCNVVTPSLILLAYIWKQYLVTACQPQYWTLRLVMSEAIPLSVWSFHYMGKTGEQAFSWILSTGKSLGFSRIFLGA